MAHIPTAVAKWRQKARTHTEARPVIKDMMAAGLYLSIKIVDEALRRIGDDQNPGIQLEEQPAPAGLARECIVKTTGFGLSPACYLPKAAQNNNTKNNFIFL